MRTSHAMTAMVCLCWALTASAQQRPVDLDGEYPGGLRLPDVNVTDRSPLDPGNFAAIDAEEIARLRADHPARIVNAFPGVNVQMNSGQDSLIAIRSPVLNGGAGQGSFLLVENRIPIRAPAFGNVNALMETLHENADLIEVIRGPGSVRYGSNAVHGILAFSLPEPKPFSTRAYRARAGAVSLNRLYVDARAEGLIPNVRSSYSVSSQLDSGWRESAGLSLNKAHAAIGWDGADWTVTAFVAGMALDQQSAGFVQGENAYMSRETARTNPDPDAFRRASSVRGHLRSRRDLGDGQLTLTPFFITQRSQFSQHYLPYNGVETNHHDSAGLNMSWSGGSDTLSWLIGANGQWAQGDLVENQPQPFGFSPDDMRFPQGLHYDYRVGTLTGAVYGEFALSLSRDIGAVAGVRAEIHRYDYSTALAAGDRGRFRVAADRRDDFALLLPKAGVIWNVIYGMDLYVNYARGGRAPQASDLYRLQTGQTVGDIVPENTDSFELGARGNLFGAIEYELSAYTMDKRAYFFRDSDGVNVPNGATRHMGIEAGLRANLGSIMFRGGVSYALHSYQFDRDVADDTEDIGLGNRIDTAPEWLADLSVGYGTGRLTIFLDMEHVGSYFTDASNQHSYPGHTLFGLRADLDLSDNAVLTASVRNLFDVRYAARADFAFGNERYFPGEPRTFGVGLRVRRQK